MSGDETPKRGEIEDTTAARLAEIVAGAERAAKRVIDEAEAEARHRLAGAEKEAERVVAERLAALAELTAEVEAQAETLKRGAESLQRALAEIRAEIGGPETFGGSTSMRGKEVPPATRQGPSPSLTVVGRDEAEPTRPVVREARSAEDPELGPEDRVNNGEAPTSKDGVSPAGARLLATQMAVSGSSRAEIEARLRTGFAIEDTTPILDAILGPEA